MDHIYTNPRSSGAFGGVQRLRTAAANSGNGKSVTVAEAKGYLRTKDAYTLHKQVRRRFPRKPIRYQRNWRPLAMWSCRFCRGVERKRWLSLRVSGHRQLSKYLWAEPMKNKTAESTKAALEKIFARADPRKPQNVLTDKGSEFRNTAVVSIMGQREINFYQTKNPDTKAAIAERVIRTLKSRIYKYFTHRNTERYVDQLQSFVDSYNHSYHRSIKTSPINVTEENEARVKHTLFPNLSNIVVSCKFKQGDQVRLSREKWTFQKGYHKAWTEKIFTVNSCLKRVPAVYKVEDYTGEVVDGTFYAEELQKVDKSSDQLFKIEKVLKRKSWRVVKSWFLSMARISRQHGHLGPEENIRTYQPLSSANTGESARESSPEL